MKISGTNQDLKEVVECMAALCGRLNRLPVLTSLAAGYIKEDAERLYGPVDREWQALILEHGHESPAGSGQYRVRQGVKGFAAWQEEAGKLMAAEMTLEIEKPLELDEIMKGYSRDPETGARGDLDISPDQLHHLVRVGIIRSEEEEARKAKRAEEEAEAGPELDEAPEAPEAAPEPLGDEAP